MSLTIKELSASVALDQAAMTAIHGGDNGNAISTVVDQGMIQNVPVAILAGGPVNTNVNVTGKQTSNVYNDQYAGDSFFVGLPFFPSI